MELSTLISDPKLAARMEKKLIHSLKSGVISPEFKDNADFVAEFNRRNKKGTSKGSQRLDLTSLKEVAVSKEDKVQEANNQAKSLKMTILGKAAKAIHALKVEREQDEIEKKAYVEAGLAAIEALKQRELDNWMWLFRMAHMLDEDNIRIEEETIINQMEEDARELAKEYSKGDIGEYNIYLPIIRGELGLS